MSGGERSSNHGPDRGADHDMRNDAMRKQRAHDPDMGETARCSAAKRKPNDGPPPAAQADLIAVVGFAWAASSQSFKHLTDSRNI
jgi:hypothetical protein